MSLTRSMKGSRVGYVSLVVYPVRECSRSLVMATPKSQTMLATSLAELALPSPNLEIYGR